MKPFWHISRTFLFLIGSVILFTSTQSGCTNAYDGGYTAATENYHATSPMAEENPAFNTEEYDRIVENEFEDPNQSPYSTFSIDVDAASYANMRRFINRGELPPADAIRTEELVNYFTYDYDQPTSEHPFSVAAEVSDCPWAPSHQLIHIGLQGKTIPTDNLPATNLVFLIDVSGSMQDPNKLPLLKQSFGMLVEELRPEDRVAIVVYAGSSGLVLPSTTGDHKLTILKAMDKLQAGGGTNCAEGIELAYSVAVDNFIEGGNNRVILATDGDFNIGQSSDAALERLIEQKRETGVYLTVLGFGMGNYKDSKMQTLADKGNGNHAYIDNLLEAKKVLVSEFGGTLFTIAKDVKLQVEFNPEVVKGYRLIGYENRLLADEDFNDDKKDAGEMGSGHTVTALYEIIPAGSEEEIRDVDATRYQKTTRTTPVARGSGEMAHVKIRYKQPDGETSQLFDHTIRPTGTSVTQTSRDFRWSASVAEFSLLLRDSKFKANANYDQVLDLAQGAVGEDKEGYRAEFIGLVKRARAISGDTPLVRNND